VPLASNTRSTASNAVPPLGLLKAIVSAPGLARSSLKRSTSSAPTSTNPSVPTSPVRVNVRVPFRLGSTVAVAVVAFVSPPGVAPPLPPV
jgi:hypothetical protein